MRTESELLSGKRELDLLKNRQKDAVWKLNSPSNIL